MTGSHPGKAKWLISCSDNRDGGPGGGSNSSLLSTEPTLAVSAGIAAECKCQGATGKRSLREQP